MRKLPARHRCPRPARSFLRLVSCHNPLAHTLSSFIPATAPPQFVPASRAPPGTRNTSKNSNNATLTDELLSICPTFRTQFTPHQCTSRTPSTCPTPTESASCTLPTGGDTLAAYTRQVAWLTRTPAIKTSALLGGVALGGCLFG